MSKLIGEHFGSLRRLPCSNPTPRLKTRPREHPPPFASGLLAGAKPATVQLPQQRQHFLFERKPASSNATAALCRFARKARDLAPMEIHSYRHCDWAGHRED